MDEGGVGNVGVGIGSYAPYDGNRSLGSRQRQQPGVAFSETRNEAGDPERLTVVQVGKTGFSLRYEYRNGYLWMVNGEGRLS